MSLIIYNIILKLYQILITIISPFHPKAKLWVMGRSNYFTELQRNMYKNTAPIIWFHCASLGEFEQSRPLIEGIKKAYSGYNILLTFFSPSGFEVRKNYEHADYVFYLPLDSGYNARKFIRVVNPKIALFAKYEFWHYYISELYDKNIPVISFSAIFRKNQIFFKPYGSMYRSLLTKIDKIFVQNQESVRLLNELNIYNTEFAGDTRFDRVKTICDQRKSFPLIEKFKENKRLLVIGSCWDKDIEILQDLINDPEKDMKVIIAPHEINEKRIHSIEKKLLKKYIRYSGLNEQNASHYDALLIDNIGMLSSLYQYAEFAFVGGAFGKGLHNILEPATFGLPVFFGPRYDKFQEAKDLTKMGSAFPVSTPSELKEKFDLLYQNEKLRMDIGGQTKSYISQNTGATDKILHYCKQFLA